MAGRQRRLAGRAGTARRSGLAMLSLGVALSLAGCTGSDDDSDAAPPPPRPPAPVALVGDGPEAGTATRIGVLVAVGTAPGQGSDVAPGAEGARVAAFRLGLDGGTAPELVAAVDDGTPSGATAAMEELIAGGVSGIVVGSSGDHLRQAVESAAAADVPVLLPYWRTSDPLPDGVWVTGPDADTVQTRLREVMALRGLFDPFVISADGAELDGIEAAQTMTFLGDNPEGLAGRLERAGAAGDIDSILISGPAPMLARVTGLVQGRSDLPVLLTPEALTPAFAPSLLEEGGTVAGRLTTVGADATDTSAVGRGGRAEQVASYFEALRLAAGSTGITDLLGDRPFAEVAGDADIASHDAVLALVRAVAEAGSTDPAAVRDALSGLALDHSAGLAGPPLEFSDATALAPGEVVELNSTAQSPGLRPQDQLDPATTDDAPERLYWFAVTDRTAD